MIRRPKKQLQLYADERYYYTPRLYLASYLCAHGMELVNIDRDSLGTVVFVFRDRIEREDLVHEFKYGSEALVDARKFTLAICDLKQKVQQIPSKKKTTIHL